MPEDIVPDPIPDPVEDKPDPDAGAKKALDAERKARRDAERQLVDIQAQLKDLTDKDKTETEKLRDQVVTLTKERDDHATKVIRAEVAMSKGLSAVQAKRLVGSTKEELEADADEILEAFPSTPGGLPSRQPSPDLTGGGDPTEVPVETDPAKLAETIPRP